MKKRKIVYIAHPIGGDVENNLAEICQIIRSIARRSTVTPFVPYYAYVCALEDSRPGDRAAGMQFNSNILQAGCVDELWLTGKRISEGMHVEIIEARHLGIPVKNYIGKEWK